MDNKKSTVPMWGIIALVFGILSIAFFFPNIHCGSNKNVYTKKTDTTRIFVYDSVEVKYTTGKNDPNAPKLVFIDNTRVDTVYITDTAQLIRDWQTKAYYYKQELRDSIYNVLIEDTIYQNAINWRSVAVKRIKPLEQLIITNTITELAEPKRAFYIHAQAQIGPNFGFSPGIIFQTKKQTLYSLHTNIMQQPNLAVGVGFKLGKK